MEKIMELKRAKTFKALANMKLLAFLLIITEIFILFNSASGYQKKGGGNHWPPPPPSSSSSSSSSSLGHHHDNQQQQQQQQQQQLQEDIREFPRYNDQKQMIRVSGIETATYTTIEQKPEAPSEGHQASLNSWPFPPLSSSSSSSSPSSFADVPNCRAKKRLDRYHHSSANIHELANVNALAYGIAGGASIAGVAELGAGKKSNPLIERQTTTILRNKRNGDSAEEAAAPADPLDDPLDEADSDNDTMARGGGGDSGSYPSNSGDHLSNQNVQVNELKLPASEEYRVYQSSKKEQSKQQQQHQKYLGRKNIRPHFSVENHEGYVGSRFRDKTSSLCHRDCSHVVGSNRRARHTDGAYTGVGNKSINGQEMVEQPLPDSYRICGSDGRLYGSVCELKLQSCRQNFHLFRRPRSFCLQQQHQHQKRQQQQQNFHTLTTTTTTPLATSQMVGHQYRRNSSEEVRIVELKRRCNSPAYNEMKLFLIREFNGDVSSMFNYFDTNGDNYIEAHELWPRQGDRSNKLLYAQLWDEHSSKCRNSNKQQNYARFYSSRPTSGHPEDPTKCWFFLDFAFEPQFAPNPCSLSHLMLFDLKHPNNRFNLESFRRAFGEPGALWASEIKATKLSSNSSNTGENYAQLPLIRFTRVQIMLGKSISLGCLLNITNSVVIEANLVESEGLDDGIRCLWTRNNLNLGALQDPHIHIEKQNHRRRSRRSGKSFSDLTLELKDAQLYLSGHYKCACYSKKIERTFEHLYSVQVSAEPRVNVRPQFQWSLPDSRVSFECHYDYIDTKDDKTEAGQRVDSEIQSDVGNGSGPLNDGVLALLDERGQFGIRVKWLKDNRELEVDSNKFNGLNQSQAERNNSGNNNNGTTIVSSEHGDVDDDSFYSPAYDSGYSGSVSQTSPHDNDNDGSNSNNNRGQELAIHEQLKLPSFSFRQASITMAASRLTLENLTLSDSGKHTCRVDVPSNHGLQQFRVENSAAYPNQPRHHSDAENPLAFEIYGQSDGTLLVQEQPKSDQSGTDEISRTYLWMFHDNGISIYRLQNDDGQEMELLREINGHSLVSGEVDGNWNQLTLCGGLNPEQVVICEWSDNALHMDVRHGLNSKTRKYIYVGQPNLNRVIVMDGLKFEIVAIINTEPQPRKLYSYKPSKIHLSKWVRRRLSPAANARWLAAIGTHAHSLKSTPEAKLYSMANPPTKTLSRQQRHTATSSGERPSSTTNQRPLPLVQHDIWLLCYGQPLVVDPSGDEHSEEASRFYSAFSGENFQQSSSSSSSNTTSNDHKLSQRSSMNSVQPFTPRLTAGAPFGWPVWPNKESKLRNRKSVHIIQSTFFPGSTLTDDSLHNHDNDESNEGAAGSSHRTRNDTVVGEFKRSTVLTTHHVFSGISASVSAKPQLYLARAQFDLIQDLYVPPKPYSLELNDMHKTHYAYVTHYDDRRLFRVSMDEYRYDREIDLQNCDPINLVTTAQGLLVVQCRAPITHNLIGQMVLDQLTSSRIEFNANIRAQESYLSPDHRYLVSIFNSPTTLSLSSSTTTTTPLASNAPIMSTSSSQISDAQKDKPRNKCTASSMDSKESKRQSIIYVQMVTVSGLRLQYEIKTALEISQCSFVWKDGYYAAIFVSTNRRDDQSEILSLRLADSRLQLMARVPGITSVARHKDQLIVSPELRLAALSTNQGSYVVDLEDNRVSQSLRHHQSPPTLLWA